MTDELTFRPLRDVLNDIWRDGVVRCPRHIVCWNSDHGTHVPQADVPLFYAKGERVTFLKRKPTKDEK